MTTAYPPVSVDCYVRATAPRILVDDIIDTVHTYDEAGLLEECTVEIWPDNICLTGGREDTAILSRYRQFQAWADREGVSLEPGFRRRERTSLVSEDSETVLVLPVVCLAIRVHEELVGVVPHTAGATSYTIEDALADIKSHSTRQSERFDEFPPDHPIRSALASLPAEEDQQSRTVDDKKLSEQ